MSPSGSTKQLVLVTSSASVEPVTHDGMPTLPFRQLAPSGAVILPPHGPDPFGSTHHSSGNAEDIEEEEEEEEEEEQGQQRGEEGEKEQEALPAVKKRRVSFAHFSFDMLRWRERERERARYYLQQQAEETDGWPQPG